MSFLFIYVCDLLEKLEEPHLGDVPLLPGKLSEYTNREAVKWFQLHNSRLSDFGVNSDALVLMLRPEKSTDRDYGLDAETLELVLARILQLSTLDYFKLQRWQREPHLCDLGLCVSQVLEMSPNVSSAEQPIEVSRGSDHTSLHEHVLTTNPFFETWPIAKLSQQTPVPSQGNKVTVEEIDRCLVRIASHHPNSSPAVQSLATYWKRTDAIDLLGGIFTRLRSREAKWLTRYILKEYGPVKVPEKLQPDSSHSGLPNFLGVSVDLFPRIEASTAYRDGTMIIKGSHSITPRTDGRLPRPLLHSKSIGKKKPGTNIHEDRPPKVNLNRINTATSVSRAAQASQEISRSDEPITFQRGLLKPRIRDENQALAPENAAKSPGRDTSTKETKEYRSFSMSPTRSGGTKQNLAPHPNLGAPSPSRRALGQISANASFSSGSPSKTSSQASSTPFRPTNPLLRAGSGQCQLTTSTVCPLTRCIFLLSPSISDSPRLIDKLLPWHGALYLTSLSALASPYLPTHCPVTRKNYRKIVLVDMQDRQATVDFLCKVEDLKLQHRVKRGKRDGRGRKCEKEWVEAYDWRLLECMAKIDQGKELGYNAWKRCFLCVV